jgi:COMM domain containing 4
MRFRFCGGLDAPDWLLAEIAILSPLGTATCAALCKVVVHQLKTATLDYVTLESLTKKGEGGDLKQSDVKGVVAALNYILRNACKYGVDRADLETEIQQMGLTKDAATSVGKQYVTSKDTLVAVFRDNSLTLAKPKEVEWRVDAVLGSSAGKPSAGVCVQMRLDDDSGNGTTSFEVEANLFKLLHAELSNAQQQLQSLSGHAE